MVAMRNRSRDFGTVAYRSIATDSHLARWERGPYALTVDRLEA